MPLIPESNALILARNFKSLDAERQAKAREVLRQYRDQQEDLGEPEWPSQARAEQESKTRLRGFFEDLKTVDAAAPALSAALPYSQNPDQLRAKVANNAYLASRYGKSVEEISDMPELYRNDYAAQKFSMTQGVDDLSFYAAAAKEIQREKQKEDTSIEGVKAALRGDDVIPALQAWQAKNLDRMPDSTEFTRGFLQARESIAGVGVSDAVEAYQRAMQGSPKDGDAETLKDFEALLLDLPGAKRKAVLTAAAMMAQAKGENAVKGVGARESGPMGGAGSAINAITGFFQEIGESGGRFAGKIGGIAKDEELDVMANLPALPLLTDAAKARHPLATGVAYTSTEKIDTAEKAADFIKEWKVTNFGTASADVTRADIEEAGQTAKQYRELDADEKKLIEAAQKRELKKNQIARELRSIAESSDPVGEVSGAIGSSVAMAAANIITRGKTLPISWQLYSEANYDQLRLENPSLEPSEARAISRVSGAGEAALDALEIGILRKLPSVAAVLKSGTGAAWRNAGARLGATFAFEQAQEGVQDLTLPFTRAVFEAVGRDTGLDMAAEWERWKDSRGTVAIASIPLILLGAGIATHRDIKDAQNWLSSRDRLGEQGIIEVEAVPIIEAAQAGKMEEAQALYRNAFKRRSSEVAAEYQAKLETQQKAVAEAVVEVTRLGLIPEYTLLPGGKVVVTDLSDGSKATFDSWRDAQPIIEQNMNEMERINNDSILRIADDILQRGEEVTVSPRSSESLADRVRGGSMSPEDAIKAAIAGNVIKGVSIDEARKIAADVFGESQEERIKVMREAVERAIVLGSNVVQNGVSKSKLFKGANLTTLIEETSEGRLKEGLRAGRYKKSDWLGLIRQAEEATGEKFLLGSTEDAVNASPDFAPRELVEAVSRIVVADVLGRLQDGRRIGSGSITKSLEENNSPLVAWIRAFKRLLASVLRTAKRIREARKTGKLGDEYDAYIDDLLGVDQQAALEGEAAAEAEAIANEALYAGGASFSEESPGPNGETFSLGYLGNVQDSGNVQLKAVDLIRATHESEGLDQGSEGMGTFRYRKDNETLYWHFPPGELRKESAIAALERKGFKVKRSIVMVFGSEDSYLAHGLAREVATTFSLSRAVPVEFEAQLESQQTLDLENDQVIVPKFNADKDTLIESPLIDDVHLMVRNRDEVQDYGPHEFFFNDNDDNVVGFARLTKSPDEVSINLIYIEPDRQGQGIGSAFYKYWLDRGVSVKSDKEITDATAELYKSLVRQGYGAAIENNRAVLKPFTGETFSFAGVRANVPQFMQDSLITAKAMALEGKDAELIRSVTGWFPGKYDGKMRWEIPDEDARYLPAVKGAKFGVLWNRRLDEVLDHPKLFAAYPYLRNVRVQTVSGLGVNGSIQGDVISLNAENWDVERFSTLLHEVQHWIQKREGFAVGSNPQAENERFGFLRSRLNYLESTDEYKAGLRLIDRAWNAFDEASFSGDQGEAATAAYNAAEGAVEQIYRDNSSLREARKVTRQLQKLTYGQLQFSAKNAYSRSAGEIEARDVQARQSFTPEQRKAISPYSSENIDRDAAIIMGQAGIETFSLRRKFDFASKLAPAAEMLRNMRQSGKAFDFATAYRAASAGQSTSMLPLAALYDEAKKQVPTLTETEFGKQVQALYDSGNLLLEPGESAQAVGDALGRFGVRDSLGIPAMFARPMAAGETFSVATDRNLVTVHNLTENNLKHALKVGGLAVPSLGVVRTDLSNFDSFGEITLIARPDLIDPQRNKSSKVFNADVYSPRYPTVKTVFSRRELDKVGPLFKSYFDELSNVTEKTWSWSVGNLVETLADEGFDRLQSNYLAQYAYLRSVGLIQPPVEKVDGYKFSDALRLQTNELRTEIVEFVRSKVDEAEVQYEEKIPDGFTSSGKRKFLPHDLDTVVKIMTRKLKDGEGFNYGVPSIRAANAKPFKTLKAIQDSRDKIVTTEEMEALKKEVNDEFVELAELALSARKTKPSFGGLDAVSDDMKALVQGDRAWIREMYGDDSVVDKMKTFVAKLRDMPTEYFEAKIRRAVQLQEFEAAVVPSETSESVKAALRKKGIAVREYQSGDKASRRLAIESASAEFGATFSLRSGDFASRMAAAFSPFQRNPELRMAIAQVAKQRAQRLGAEWIEKAAVIRSTGDIGKESQMREALAYEARMNEYLDGLTPNARQTLEFEPSSLESDPLISAMLDHGKLMSRSTAKKLGKVEAKSGDYDGAPWLPPAWYSKGAGIMPDQMAQAMHDAGLLPDAYTDTLWKAVASRIASTKKDKAAHREAVTAYKAAQKYARDASRAEADKWAEGAKKTAGSPKAQRDMLKAALRTLDGILSAAPPEVRARVGGYVKLAGLATDEAMLQEIERRIAKLNVELEKWLKKEGVAEIQKLLKRGRPEAEAGKRGKGKDPDMHALFAAAERAIPMTAEAVAGELARLDTLIGGDTLTPEQEALAITERGIVELVGDLKSADSGRVFSALDSLREIYEGGWLKWKLRQIEKREERAGQRADFIADTGKSGVKPERDEADKAAVTLLGKIKGGFLSLSSFQEVLSYAFGAKSDRVKALVDAEREASGQYEDVTQALADEVEALFADLAGGSVLAGEHMRFDMAQRTIKTGKGELSQLEAIQALLMWRQEDGRRHMEGARDENGKPIGPWNYDQTWIDEITAALTLEARSVMAWLSQKYAAEHPALNALYRERYGVNMPAHDNYAPITVQPVQTKSGEVNDPVSGAAISSGSILVPGSLRARSRSAIAEPDFRDSLQTFMAHTRQLEYWKAYYDLAFEASAILGNREVLNAVKAKGGEPAATALRKWIDAIAQGGFRDASASLGLHKLLSRMTGRAASVGLLGRFSTLLVQSTQLGAASVKMPVGAYLIRLSKLLTGNLSFREAINSPFIQRRYKSAPPIVRQALEGLGVASRPNQITRATRHLGQLLSGADAMFTAGTYAMLLDYHRGTGRALGLSGAELETHAHTEAERDTEAVAQPTRMATRSLAELTSTNPLAKVSWAYASEARQKIALMAWATMNAKAEPAQFAKTAFLVFGIGGLMTQILKNLWREAKGDDDESKWSPERLALSALAGPLHGVPLASELMGDQGMLSGVAWAWPALKDIASGEGDMRDVDTLLSTMGLFNDTAAGIASLSHAGLDAAKVLENLASEK